MELSRPAPEIMPFGLRALKMVAVADGSFAEAERHRLQTAATSSGAPTISMPSIPIAPEELARRLVEPALRRQIVRGMVVLSREDARIAARGTDP